MATLYQDEIWPSFEVATAVEFGTGAVGNPQTGSIPLLCDVGSPKFETGLPQIPATSPVVFLIHGGGFASGDKSNGQQNIWQGWLNARGYRTVSMNYRVDGDDPTLIAGPPPSDWVGQPSMPQFSTDAALPAITDISLCISWAAIHAMTGNAYGFDMSRIALIGNSAGGIAALAIAYYFHAQLAADGLAPQCVINQWGGMWGADALHVAAGCPPCQTWHDTADILVPYAQATNLETRLDALGIYNELITTTDGANHGISHADDNWETLQVAVDGTTKTLQQHALDFLYEWLVLGGVARRQFDVGITTDVALDAGLTTDVALDAGITTDVELEAGF